MVPDFDPERHEYRVNGVKWPGVTSLLSALHSFAGVPLDVLNEACERGSLVHELCELDDLGTLKNGDIWLRGKYGGYLRAWRQFVTDTRPVFDVIEQPLAHKLHRYCGTPDRGVASMAGRPRRAVLDVKTSANKHPVWGLQTAAYRELLAQEEPAYRDADRLTVQLRPDGTYAVEWWQDPMDWPVFLSLVNVSRWKEKYV